MMTCILPFFSPFLFLKSNYLVGTQFFIDGSMSFFLMIFPFVFFLLSSSIFNSSYSSEAYRVSGILLFLFLFLILGLSSSYPFLFIIMVELCSVLMIFFVLEFSKDKDKISSALFMFFLNMLGSIPFLFFCLILELKYSTFLSLLECTSSFLYFCFLLILVCKLPVFFFHFWLTKAHVSASGTGSMILASIMLKIGSVGLMKWSFLFFKKVNPSLMFLLSFTLLCSIFLLLVMNRFFDLKYLVACSSVVHMAFTFPFFLFSSVSMFNSSVMMMVVHGVVSCVVFFLITILYESSFDRSSSINKSMESFSAMLSLFLTFWMVMNLGFPPFLSFLSELYFCFSLILMDLAMLPFMFLFLILSGSFFINIITNFLFSKKTSLSYLGYSNSLSLLNLNSALIFVLLFLFYC